MTELEALLTLNALPQIGPIRARRLMDSFGSASAVFSASRKDHLQVAGLGEQTAQILADWKSLTSTPEELRELEERGIAVLTPADPAWPSLLREMPDPPLLLYVWGELQRSDSAALAVIGSRKTTHYGREITKTLSFQLAAAGWTIISGLARGIDSYAHEAALAAEGRTIAVLGSGLAQLYPSENMALAQRIAEQGAVVTEFSLHTPPSKKTFPQRNRIVAGWASGTVVTEMPSRSGAMITARLAQEYGRQVFAVPGPVDRPSSEGCNRLIRDGATLACGAQDLLDDLAALSPSSPESTLPVEEESPKPPLEEPEGRIYDCLNSQEQSIDELLLQTDLPPAEVSVSLLSLELKGLAKQHPGMHYTRA